MHIFIFSSCNKNEAVSLVPRRSLPMWRRRLSAVAQGPLTMRGRSGRHVNGCLRQEAAPPFPHRIGALAAEMGSRVAVTDCRSWALTDRQNIVCAVRRAVQKLFGTYGWWLRHGFCRRRLGRQQVVMSILFTMVLRLVPVLQALLGSRICRGEPRKRPQVPLDPAACRRRLVVSLTRGRTQGSGCGFLFNQELRHTDLLAILSTKVWGIRFVNRVCRTPYKRDKMFVD